MKLYKIALSLVALILVGGGVCFSQSNKTGQIVDTNIRQEEHVAALEKKIVEAGDDFVSLTAEEYDLMLSKLIGTVDGFEPLTTTAGGITVGIGFRDDVPKIWKTNIQIIFPDIPNIGEGEVFVIFNFVKGTNGLDFLDRQSNTENKENQFTELALDSRKALQKSYWFGSRYVNLRDPMDDITVRALGALGDEVRLSAVSGKVVMYLPTNITGLTLAKGDIGVEKPFAGGILTLKDINKARISFQFSGDTKKIYTWIVYDVNGNIIDINNTSLKNGLYQIAAKNPQSVKVYQAEIVRKEYPFAFENESHATSEGVSSVQEKKSAPSALFEGVEAARFSAAMLFQTQLLQTKNVAPVYLDKNDPIVISIKGRAVTDLRQSTRYMDPESPESKLIETQVKAWSEEKKNQLQALGGQSIEDYTAQTLFDAGTFMLVFSSFKEMDQKKIAEEWDIRVQHLGGDKYIAEFWEDSHAVNPEAKSEIGENARCYKMMALLYTLKNESSITFNDPFQPVIDFIGR